MKCRVAVLLPTRGRPKLMQDSIASFMDKASVEADVITLVAVDPDDPDSFVAAVDVADHVITTRERYGYAQLNRYYNLLARDALMLDADWLVLWNDDAAMLTQEWDRRLAELPSDVAVAEFKDQLWPGLVCFPAVRAEAVKVVGGFSPHTCHCDSYWQDMGRTLGLSQAVNVHMVHNRADLTGKNNDEVFAEGQANYQTSEYYGPRVQAAIRADMEMLRKHYAAN